MLYEIFLFEIKYRAKRPETYLFFVLLFLFALIGVDFVFQGVEIGAVKKNAPIIIAKTMAALTGIFMIVASLIMGVPILRDFQYDVQSLLFVNPIRKRDYLLGRFLGSFTILLFIFSGLLLGSIGGEFMPWRHPDDLMPFSIMTHLHCFFVIVFPILFFGAALFFTTGALTKNMMVIYTQAIILFVCFLLTKSITNEFLQAILDPFSLTTLTDIVSSRASDEHNTQLVPVTGLLFYNKLFWSLFGIIILWLGYQRFQFTEIKSKTRKKEKHPKIAQAIHSIETPIPRVVFQYNWRNQFTQLLQLAWFHFLSISKQTSFLAIVFCEAIIIIINSINLGTIHGVDSYPKTYFIVEELQELSLFFFVVILIFYSGEIIWKEKEAKFNFIFDATPISNLTNILSKYLGLVLIYIVLIGVLIVFGICFQTIQGFYEFDFPVYFSGFFLEVFPFLLLYTLISFCLQILANNKLIGFVLTLFFAFGVILFQAAGFQHDLLAFGGSTLGIYSDMNGYEQEVAPYLMIKIYWLIFSMILLAIASTFISRGIDIPFRKRWTLSRKRFTEPLKYIISAGFACFIFLGVFIFYNTNIRNDYWNTDRKETFRMNYEKQLKKYKSKPQPTITEVYLKIDLYPTKKEYIAKGYHLLTNTSSTPISEIHVQKRLDNHIKLEVLEFDHTVRLNKEYEAFGYYIYTLAAPLLKGDTMKMSFEQSYTTVGFEEETSTAGVFQNGTFLNQNVFPTLGYNKKYELQDARTRENFAMPLQATVAKKDNLLELVRSRTGGDNGLINFEAIISTTKDQTAIAPGTLMKNWTENNRSFFHYKMEAPIINFYAILSGEYETLKGTWTDTTKVQDVDLEIYYHSSHEYNLKRMMESMKASLSYCSSNFSPYQYQQLRIIEFPRYTEFAQSFPGTIPFSEGIGFMLNINDEKEVDMAFYITAHETAHHWWGMQLEAANVQGQNMILESLAQYSALMIMQQKYSDEKIQQFLSMELENYELKRKKDSNEEPPLDSVGDQNYVYYEKGGINFYTFQKYIGEEKVNLALRHFLKDWNSRDGLKKSQVDRYATSDDLLEYFHAVTPDSLQYVVSDLFKKVNPIEKLH